MLKVLAPSRGKPHKIGLKVLIYPHRVLLDAGCDIDARDADRTALFVAVDYGSMEVAEELVKRGADPVAKSEDGSSPLRRVITLAETDARWEKISDLMLKS